MTIITNKFNVSNRVFFLFSFLLTISLLSQAQPGQQAGKPTQAAGTSLLIGKLKGTIIDSRSREPLMFASIVLSRAQDSTMVSGSITDEKGKFFMEQLPPGNFYLTVNYIGYNRQSFNSIKITFREPEFDMGIIEVAPVAQTLESVTVEANRSLMETGLNRRVINVAQELTSIGGTAVDVMQNIPSVSVDFEGNVSLRGNSNVTILIDGRPSSLTGLSGSEALQQIPAAMIERVEVITNPSARYNPEGTSGIINVVLKKQRRPGYNGLLTLNAATADTYSGTLNFNYKYNKWNIFTNLSGRFSDTESFGNSQRQTFFGQAVNFMDQKTTGLEGMNSVNGQLGADYSFNDRNILTVSSRFNNWERTSDDLTRYSIYQDIINPGNLFKLDNFNSMMSNSFTHQLNYKRTYAQRVREFNADINFSHRTMDRRENFLQQFYENNFDTPKDQLLRERSMMDNNNWSFSSQLDYVHPLGEASKIETGFRLQTRQIDSDFLFENEINTGNWMNNASRSNRFIYDEQVLAAYGMYATKLGKFSLQAGLRAEQTLTSADLQNDIEPANENDYLSFFPTLHLRRNFEGNRALQISYTRRINRPDNRSLNPFVRYNSEYDVSFGNPNLKPEYIDSYEVGYTHFWKSTTLNPSLFYRQTDGMISWYRYVDNIGGKDVTVSTQANINRGTSYGAELIFTQRITSWWNMNSTFSYFRTMIEGAQMAREADSYSWSGRFVSNMNLGKGWNVQVNAFYRSPVVMLQGEMAAMYSANAGVQKNILGNSGTLSLNISDIFNTMRFGMYNYGDNFNMSMERWRTSRMISLGFTYRINEFERRNNRRDRGNDNGDSMDFDRFDM